MCEKFNNLLKRYLINANIYNDDDECVWEIVHQEPYGRCIFAKKDIQINELIFKDKPLLIGPRVHNYEKVFCVSCYKILPKLTLCNEKCKFPVCKDCEHSLPHQQECSLIRSWEIKNQSKYSKHLFRALTVIRGLLLSDEDKELMFMMACHENSVIQNMEVDKILEEFENLTEDSETVRNLKRISSVLNTNAFEVSSCSDSQLENKNISLRVR